ncbi:MAG: helix-turn-helix domain containing protein [Candidatus Accumulibacter sp.]|jgi:hypothetical protein|nr:helix-turn-helix domain containing protein [Accumulibacter sp.]
MQPLKEFTLRLERLKASLGVSDDQALAQSLGMTKAALLGKKARGAWPEEEVRALALRYPELGLDLDWVVTGESEEAWKAMFTASQKAAEKASAKATRVRASGGDATQETTDLDDLTEEEQRLIALFRRCVDESKAMVLQLTELMVKE